MIPKPSIIFFGTPEFAVPALRSLLDNDFNIKAVITRPDKPVGRKQILTPPPVKVLALEHDIKVLQPVKISAEFIEEVKALAPDLFVIVAYGKILPQTLLDIPTKGSINIHPSLLPKYRGPSPLQATLLSDDTETGVCIMLIDEEMDHGPLLRKLEFRISNFENYESLGEQLFELGAKNLPETINQYLSGKLQPEEQNHYEATFTKLIKKEAGLIDWSQSAIYIEKMTRAYRPWPGAYGNVMANDKPLEVKIIRAQVSSETTELPPGTIFKTEDNGLAIACGSNTVLIVEEIQPAGKPKMTAEAFMSGYIK